MIRLEHINKSFTIAGKQVVAVKDANVCILEGSISGFIGFSGAGKSTLVRCINLLERPDRGNVIVDGIELTTLKEKELRKIRKKIGMIFQQFHLFSARTVFQNIAFPLKGSGLTKKEINEKVHSLLKLVELEEKADSYPSQLSGGQKQRVAIARALADDPKILISDESTSALDPQTTKSILRLLRKLNQELHITIIIITHEMHVIKEICDTVYVMEAGEIVESGEVFEIFASPKKQITKNFVESTSNLSKIYELLEEKEEITNLNTGQCIIKFKYLEKDVSEPLVSLISRKYALNINIIFGNIELIKGHPVGGLVAIMEGESSDINQALQFLQEKNIGVEVLSDARVS